VDGVPGDFMGGSVEQVVMEAAQGLPVLGPCREGAGRLVEILREHQHESAQRLV
jgi:uncharacterized NAD-dependent epimerase/dehydratase family protein